MSEEVMKHVVTQEDLDNNPALVEAGAQVGDEIELPLENGNYLNPGPTEPVQEAKPNSWESTIKTPFPVFEGVQVTAVIEVNVGEGKWHRCEMANGTTRDVPKELFAAE